MPQIAQDSNVNKFAMSQSQTESAWQLRFKSFSTISVVNSFCEQTFDLSCLQNETVVRCHFLIVCANNAKQNLKIHDNAEFSYHLFTTAVNYLFVGGC